MYEHIPRRLAEVRDRIANAAGRAGRKPDDVRLIAVSKTHPIDAVRAAADAGQIDFGENKVQEALQKIAQSADTRLRWHLIGHLQSNKARKAAGAVGAIHAIDSVDLLKRVDQAAGEAGRTVDVLIQVDLALEDTKYGAPVNEVPAIVEAADACTAARLTGLMLLPPLAENPEDARPWFARLRALRDELVEVGVAGRSVARTVDGHEPRFRSGDRGRRDDGARRHGDIRREALRMKVTPLDLRQQRFKTVMRGYDRGEVQAFLLEVADDYENALRENDKLRQDVTKLDAVLAEHRGQERNLRNTLLTAQKHADDIKEHAQTEAGLIVREAEGQRDLLLQKAQARLEDVQREIDGLRLKRREVENDIEALVRTLNSTLEFIRDQDARSRDERVLLHRPRPQELPARPQRRAQAIVPKADTGSWHRNAIQIIDRSRFLIEIDRWISRSESSLARAAAVSPACATAPCSSGSPPRRSTAPPTTSSSRSSPGPSTFPSATSRSSRANARDRSGSGSPARSRAGPRKTGLVSEGCSPIS